MSDLPILYTPYNKCRFRVYKSLAIANSDSKPLMHWEIGVVKGDNTRFKLGDGFYSGTGYPDAKPFRGTKFANLPWTNASSYINSNANPYAANVTATLTAAQLAQQYITSTSAAPVSLTLPTATLLATQIGAIAGTKFTFTVDNSAGANPVTIVLGSGMTKTGVGSFVVPTGGVYQFEINFTSTTAATIKSYVTAPAADVAALVDNSGGTSGAGTIGVVTNPTITGWNGSSFYPTAAQATAIDTAITELTNAVATLAAQNNAMRTSLINAGLMV